MSKLLFICCLISFSFFHCDSPDTDQASNDCPEAEAYQMRDMTGLAGCSWMLVKGDQAYEVINLSEFYDSFGEDVSVVVELKTREDLASNCQAGIISEIVCKQ